MALFSGSIQTTPHCMHPHDTPNIKYHRCCLLTCNTWPHGSITNNPQAAGNLNWTNRCGVLISWACYLNLQGRSPQSCAVNCWRDWRAVHSWGEKLYILVHVVIYALQLLERDKSITLWQLWPWGYFWELQHSFSPFWCTHSVLEVCW